MDAYQIVARVNYLIDSSYQSNDTKNDKFIANQIISLYKQVIDFYNELSITLMFANQENEELSFYKNVIEDTYKFLDDICQIKPYTDFGYRVFIKNTISKSNYYRYK